MRLSVALMTIAVLLALTTAHATATATAPFVTQRQHSRGGGRGAAQSRAEAEAEKPRGLFLSAPVFPSSPLSSGDVCVCCVRRAAAAAAASASVLRWSVGRMLRRWTARVCCTCCHRTPCSEWRSTRRWQKCQTTAQRTQHSDTAKATHTHALPSDLAAVTSGVCLCFAAAPTCSLSCFRVARRVTALR